MDMLELYQSEGCPYCKKVRQKLSNIGASYVIHNPRLPGGEGGDTTNQQTFETMVEAGGKDQIPFLVDTRNENAVYETDDILAYLEEHYE